MTLFVLAISCAAIIAPQASAQADPTIPLDSLVQESLDSASGTALARRQTASGDLIGATATLERVLLNDADAEEARLMHAGLLCRLDDPAGARTELSALAGRPILDTGWADITAACGAIERPLAREGAK